MNKNTVFILLTLLYFSALASLSSCANVSSPTGGPKDTIPPQLVRIIPSPGAIGFSDQIVRLEFTEAVQAKDLQNQLIITPSITGKYKVKMGKNSAELLFDQPFDSSTTYTFSFRNGLADLTEGNPAENLSLAFSTGAYLDSLSINGTVKELLTGKPVEDALVSLYRTNDTLNPFEDRPYYLAKTNKEGFYQFNNLKDGKYFIYSTKDINSNLKIDARNEPFGFKKDTLALNSNIDSLNMKILSLNVQEPKINSSRPTGPYFEISLNKALTDYELEPLQPIEDTLYSNLVEADKKVRVYNTFPIQDSLAASFIAKDSIGQQLHDTVFIMFKESKISKAEFKYDLSPKGGSTIQESFTATLDFSKPIKSVNLDSLYFQYDSLTVVHPDTAKDFTWNSQRDKLEIRTHLDKEKAREAAKKAETAAADSLVVEQKQVKNEKLNVSLYLGKSAFISVENDSSAAQEAKYTFADPQNFGTIQGTFVSSNPQFTIQLLQAAKLNVVQEIKNEKDFKFTFVPPGEYKIRILLDENGNGKWDPGNVHRREEPEPVIIMDEKVIVKANWELRDIVINE